MFQIPQSQLEQIEKLELSGKTTFPSAAIEKDLAISAVLNVVAKVRLPELRTGFGGGTSLVKARGLMDRLSEDVDLKVIVASHVNRSRRRSLLRTHRDLLADALMTAGFEVRSSQTKLEGQFRQLVLQYQSHFSGERFSSTIQLELWQQDELLPLELLPIQSILHSQLFEPEPTLLLMEVVNLNETAAQKVVALLAYAKLIADRPKLVRHIYDIWRIAPENLNQDLLLKVFDFSVSELSQRHGNVLTAREVWTLLAENLEFLRQADSLRKIFDFQISQVAIRPVSAAEAFEDFDFMAKALLSSSQYRS